MSTQFLKDLPQRHAAGDRIGITSVCSAHPLVIEAALLHGRDSGSRVLIEATCNQVNHEGGYTGMTPADFRKLVEDTARKVGFDTSRLILGGDHLGPNPWKNLPAEEALAKAEAMMAAYIRAGFTKIHLDTSMGCLGESAALPDEITARRAARLAEVAETAAVESGFDAPVYIVGTEVPIPGGATGALDHLQVTTAEAALKTADVHRAAFADLGLEHAFERVIGIVVQPGVEFGNEDVVAYDRAQAVALSQVLQQTPQFVFEAHSTDYQSQQALSELVEDGFVILKVGPWLTFALREALYGLDHIAAVLEGNPGAITLQPAMERLMLREPANWGKHYHGTEDELRLQRHFSYSDRIRYYWPHAEAAAAVDDLLQRLKDRTIPETLVSQYLGSLYPAVAAGRVASEPQSLIIAAVRQILGIYGRASRSE